MAASNHVGSVPQNHDTTPLSDSPTGTKAAKEFNIEIRVVEQLENILQTMKTAAQVNPATSEEKDASLQPHTSHHDHLTQIRSRLGLKEEAPLDEEHVHLAHHELLWSRIRYIFKEPFAEFWGVFIMVLFGDGSVAQVLLSQGQATLPGANGAGNYQSISWGWGLGVMLGIYVAGDSGGYLNPAITFSNCLYRGLPWKRFPIYLIAQFLGGFIASGVVYANYITGIDTFEGGPGRRTVPPSKHATAGIFCTYPQPFLHKSNQFFSEFIASTMLMFVIFALKDGSNPGAMGKTGAGNFFPLALFFLIFGIGACFGWETGYAINLARDFGPRLMSYAVGYGPQVWSAGDYYFWVPIVASFLGCSFGGFLYDVFIYTGPETPMNMPWLGFKRILHPRSSWKKRTEDSRRPGEA